MWLRYELHTGSQLAFLCLPPSLLSFLAFDFGADDAEQAKIKVI